MRVRTSRQEFQIELLSLLAAISDGEEDYAFAGDYKIAPQSDYKIGIIMPSILYNIVINFSYNGK